MTKKIILASKSGVRKQILDKNNIDCEVIPANIDEEIVKESLIKEKATPAEISKNLAELKANKISAKKPDSLVLGADSVIDLKGELISKPKNREEALKILEKLNGQKLLRRWVGLSSNIGRNNIPTLGGIGLVHFLQTLYPHL